MTERSHDTDMSSIAPFDPSPATKTAILEAAERRIRDEGFHAARLTDITADAGVTTGAFYRHFSSKDALYSTMYVQMAERLDVALHASRDLYGAIDAWLKVSRDHPGTVRAQYEVVAFATPMITTWAQARDRWEAALLGLLPSRSTDDRIVASILIDAMEYYSYAVEVGWWDSDDDGIAAATLARLVEDGLYPAWPGGRQPPPSTFAPSRYKTSIDWVPAPGKSEPTSRRAIATVARLRQAAVDVFADVGVRQATMLDIAKAAGVASGTAYRYFDDKEDLLRSLMAQFEHELVNSALHGLRGSRQPVGDTYQSFLGLQRANIGVFRAWWALMEPGSDYESAWLRMHNHLMHRFVRVLRHGRDHGLIAPDLDPEIITRWYSGLHERSAFARVALDRDLGYSDGDVSRVLDRLLNGGLAAWGSASA
jgi:AcrR family transcriptional regulator